MTTQDIDLSFINAHPLMQDGRSHDVKILKSGGTVRYFIDDQEVNVDGENRSIEEFTISIQGSKK